MTGFAVAFFAVTLPNAVVIRPVVNMYSQPSQDADVVSQAIYGANVGIVEQQAEWARIRTADDYTGWTPLAALRPGQAYAAGEGAAEVASLFAHIYRETSVSQHAPLITLPFEARLEIAGEDAGGGWFETRLADGRVGWVQAADVARHPAPLSVAEMLAFSKRFLGLPYTWGGTSSYGYDCSGFMQMLERRRGVRMPRDAQPQAEWSGAASVMRDRLQPGDLLYFGASEKHITHTGMYLGDGKFINATTHEAPMVRIDDLNDPHWSRRLVAMRRVK